MFEKVSLYSSLSFYHLFKKKSFYFSQKCKPEEKKGKWLKDEMDGDFAASGAESSLSSSDPTSGTEGNDDRVNPLKWSVSNSYVIKSAYKLNSALLHVQVSEVCEFIRNLPGCSDYTEDFLIQQYKKLMTKLSCYLKKTI